VYEYIFPNNKKYFGITSRKPNKRWQNGKGYTQNGQPVIFNAIRKYGWNNIQHIILYVDLSEKEAKNKEIELIKKYMTNVCRYGNDFGYNATDGGDGRVGHRLSSETKERIRISKEKYINYKKIIYNGIVYNNISNFIEIFDLNRSTVEGWLKGTSAMPSNWYNNGLRYENEKINKNIKTRKSPCRYEIQYNGIMFESQGELGRFLNVPQKTVSKWFTGETQIPYKFYMNDIICTNDYEANKNMIPRIAISVDEIIFSSQTEACNYLNISNPLLSDWINGKKIVPHKYKERNFKIIKPKNTYLI